MLATFKETLRSLQDKTYGREIIKKDPKNVLWYWTKYLLLFATIPLAMSVASLTYFVPQLPKILKDNLPDVKAGVANHQFYVDPSDPLKFGDANFLILVDPEASESALSQYPAGVVITKDKTYFKDGGSVSSESHAEIPDFSITKPQAVTWASEHQLQIWVALLTTVLVLTVVILIFYWLFRFIFFWIWSLVFWFVAKILKKQLTLPQSFNLVVYASVIPLLVSAVLFLAPNDVISLLNIGVFLFFTVSWIINLHHE